MLGIAVAKNLDGENKSTFMAGATKYVFLYYSEAKENEDYEDDEDGLEVVQDG